MSRSASIVISYLIWKYKMNLEEAFSFVKSKRKIISPNSNFIDQLKEFSKSVLNEEFTELC